MQRRWNRCGRGSASPVPVTPHPQRRMVCSDRSGGRFKVPPAYQHGYDTQGQSRAVFGTWKPAKFPYLPGETQLRRSVKIGSVFGTAQSWLIEPIGRYEILHLMPAKRTRLLILRAVARQPPPT